MELTLKETLQKEGLRIVQTWHILLLIAGMILYGGVIYGVSQFRLDQVEDKQVKMEQWKEKYESEQRKIYLDLLNTLNEIKSNQQLIAYKLGVPITKVK